MIKRNKMKSIIKIILVLLVPAGILTGCKKVLDKENLAAVNPSDVWASAPMANAYLNNIYAAMMPGNTSGSGNGTDEGVAYQHQANIWLQGTATVDSYNGFGQYNNIRTINILLANIENATFSEEDRKV